MDTSSLNHNAGKPPRKKPQPRRRDGHNAALARAVVTLGSVTALADLCGVRKSAAWRWIQRGHLPRTEWTGETHYAESIETACQGAVTKAELLACRPIRKANHPAP
jgi:DNA-binding transcriptional regulator YdaS (Cro superfamily)